MKLLNQANPNQEAAMRPGVKNQKGVAILMAVFSMMLMSVIAIEISNLTTVEYLVSSQSLNRVRAYYAAKAGVKFSLLRIKMYQKANEQFGEQLKGQEHMLDMIWNMDMTWPPVVPPNISQVDQGLIQSAVDESIFVGQFSASIKSESQKIDVNDLASESQALRDATKNQLIQLFQNELETNDEFYDKYSSFRFEELVNDMADWVDEDNESLNGGGERTRYEVRSDFIPPNQSFKSLQELRMLPTMTDEIFDFLKDKVTVYGIKGVNINYADKSEIQSLSPYFEEEEADLILEYRDDPEKGGYFKDLSDFLKFVSDVLRLDRSEVEKTLPPLVFENVVNFRIESTGTYANVTKTIEVITFDLQSTAKNLANLLKTEEQSNQPQDQGAGGATPPGTPPPGTDQSNQGDQQQPQEPQNNNNQNQQQEESKGPPIIIYWNES